ncbi:MAG: 50S ribosomal protein L25/general stress protein Ctc [Mariprofundaceae bacterium]|nr:50S ribosomal protein L25/general stress protein Ctc [Mariprofundaceae bacterium]
MSDFVLEAELREETGRGAARRLRRAGKTPAVIYGAGKPELAITLDTLSISKLLNTETFHTSMIDIEVKGARGTNTGLVKEIQWHPVHDQAIHIDFHRVSSSDIVNIEVPVNAINHEKCPGMVQGGLLEVIRHTLEVACRADSIPDGIDVDCAELNIGDSVHVEDLPLPDGVEILHDVNFTVLALAAPRVEEEPAETEEVESGETTAEGSTEAPAGGESEPEAS